MLRSILRDSAGRLRNGWWIAIFFAVLAAIVLPLLLASRSAGTQPSPAKQAIVVLAATAICQLLRGRPLFEVTGRPGIRWLEDALIGILAGAALMLVPALLLRHFGEVGWQAGAATLSALPQAAGIAAGVAATEELVFRGFFFQRLVDGIGAWPAQLLIGAYFVLTHAATLHLAGPQRYLAGANIFAASILFGLAFLRTKSLAMPFGLHFAADFVQGGVLGFGVSGSDLPAAMKPAIVPGHDWVTGGAFGLEASIPGMLCVLAALVAFLLWNPPRMHYTEDDRARAGSSLV